MSRFYCPDGRCEHGNIVECDNEENISDRATFTDEENYPLCPYFEAKKKENKRQA